MNTVQLTESTNAFTLLQNKPNPFTEMTEIAFVLPEAGQATLTLFDITGKVAYTATNTYSKGYNVATVSRSMLSGSGVWFYRLDSGEHSSTKKLTLVD